MTPEEVQLREKLIEAFKRVKQKVIEFKRYKKTEMVIMKDGKIIRYKP